MKKSSLHEWLLTLPSLTWLLLFFAVPSLIIFTTSFRPQDVYGGVGDGWTLTTFGSVYHTNDPRIIWRTLRLSGLCTLFCLLAATPCAYYMARAPRRRRSQLVLLMVLPFWTSFLIRVFAWRVLLHPEGPAKRLLQSLGMVAADALLLYNEHAILLVMVYTCLPFAVLPIYAAAERFDFQLLEAAMDLGARPARAFFSIFVPGVRIGLLSAVLMVFIPSLGSYVIPDLVGGPSNEMLGNKVAQRVFVDRNIPHAAALAACLTLGVLAPLAAVMALHRRRSSAMLRKGLPT